MRTGSGNFPETQGCDNLALKEPKDEAFLNQLVYYQEVINIPTFRCRIEKLKSKIGIHRLPYSDNVPS